MNATPPRHGPPAGTPPAPRDAGFLAYREAYFSVRADPLLRRRVVRAAAAGLRGPVPWARWVPVAAAWCLALASGYATARWVATPPRAGVAASAGPLGAGARPGFASEADAGAARLRALVASAALLPTPSPEARAAWRAALRDPDDDVRSLAAALLAAAAAADEAASRSPAASPAGR